MTNTSTLNFGALRAAAEETPEPSTTPKFQPAISTRALNGRTPLVNKYAGKCANCSVWLAAGTGIAFKAPGATKWAVRHADCSAPVMAPEATLGTSFLKGEAPHPGIYTVPIDGTHRTFKVTTQKPDADFMPGVTLFALLTGPQNSTDYTTLGHFTKDGLKIWIKHRPPVGETPLWLTAAPILLADPTKVLTAKLCRRCGNLLTTEESILRGCGPVCATL